MSGLTSAQSPGLPENLSPPITIAPIMAPATYDGKANDDEGSPRLQPPAHIRTLELH
jgi:hypothetical protein